MAAEAGKGSRPRPYSVSQEEYDNRWDAIFKKDNSDSEKDSEKEIADHSKEDQQ